ncbi:type I restriction enzyme, S subunit [Rosenbergiella nectarea]|uniref:Type I restriction enzyme, S subunit n=1 Tax=Rosenbergiella nectarea TaxID=988801 RepID=A0A1H9CUR9_9GAMM|nr:restriction endonuclease subunit S [Rosenbergiella nectarea]SEQ04972.1 type I restriction enzyme, S subunit [Rosenbergiella nectarea]
MDSTSFISVNLLDICNVKTGKVDANHASIDGAYKFFTCALEPLKADTYSFEGELIILPGNGANVGHVAYFKGRAEAYQRTYILYDFRCEPKFIYFNLLSNWEKNSKEKQYGSATNYIKMGNFEDYSLNLPPLAEQKIIADKLDDLLARVESIKTRLENIPKILKRFRQSVLSAIIIKYSSDKNSKEQFSTSLGSISEDIRYGTSKKCSETEGDTAVLRIPNIGSGHITDSNLKYAYFDEKELSTLSLKKGDLLLIRSNGSVDLVGKVAMVSEKDTGFLYAGYLIRIRLNLEIAVPEYVTYCLQSPQIRQIIENIARSTSGVNNINSKELSSLILPIPSLEEQNEIIKDVDKHLSCISIFETMTDNALSRINNLTQSILAKAFRGELTAQWREENPELISGLNSAEALLEKITAEKLATGTVKKRAKKTSH